MDTEEFIRRNNIKVNPTPSGLHYAIGSPPDRRGATAELYYQGRRIGERSYDEGPVLLQLDTRLLEAPPRFALDAFIQFLCAVRDDLLQPE